MSASDFIIWLSDAVGVERALVGGKARGLGALISVRLPVPQGYVIKTSAFDRFLTSAGISDRILTDIEQLDAGDLATATARSEEIRALIDTADVPASVLREVALVHLQLCAGVENAPVAVRSSATAEDSESASFAGLQQTDLWIRGVSAVLRSVRLCWSSFYSVEAICYRRRHGLSETGAMAVVVQRMVDARTAGVMFTRSPVTGDRSVITIESAWGLGSAIVGGEVTPDRWVVGKITGEIQTREVSDKHIEHAPAETMGTRTVPVPESLRRSPSLTDPELQALRDLGRQAERYFGRPQDIEWAIDHAGQIFLLQSRPVTTWGEHESEPVAKPQENPIEHVMAIFGGRSTQTTPGARPTKGSSPRPAV